MRTTEFPSTVKLVKVALVTDYTDYENSLVLLQRDRRGYNQQYEVLQ